MFFDFIYANFINLGLSHILIPIYAKLSMLQTRYIVPAVLALALLGTYASRNSITDVWILLAAGILGIVLRKNNFPLGPLVLAYIIGPSAERALRQGLLIGKGEWVFLLKSPIAVCLYVAALVFVVLINVIFRKRIISIQEESGEEE